MSISLAERNPSQPLPEKIAALVHEARWLVIAAAGLYLALILWGYDRGDPGWSHAMLSEQLVNPGGRFGAWLADLLLYLFGLSAWWWVALLGFLVAWGYRRVNVLFGGDRRPLVIALMGFVVVLAAGSGLEAMRFWSLKVDLPLAPGGMLGLEISRWAQAFLGFTGGTLAMLTLFLAGITLFLGVSWLRVAEGLGGLLESGWLGCFLLWERWQDRRYGKALAEKREAAVKVVRRKIEENPPAPVKIEPVDLEIPRAPKAEARIEKERQAALFFDAPGGALPPLHLLDEPSHKVVTRYEIEPATGVKGATIVGLAKDLARALSLVSIRVVETVPGKSCMALELPNPRRQTVRLSEIIGSKAYHDLHSPLAMSLGKDIAGGPVVADLAKMPHLLVAGTTGSGKSVGINAMILSLVYKSEPKDVRLIMVDPKMLELSIYEGIPHLLAPVVTDMNKAANALHWCVGEMERRYKLMSAVGVRNLAGLNAKIREAEKAGNHIPNPFPLVPESPEPLQTMPYVVVVIDELADLMMVVGKKVEELIARLAQKARAAGIHLILATQRPSVDVITGLIKANIPTRIAFQVADARSRCLRRRRRGASGRGSPAQGRYARVHRGCPHGAASGSARRRTG